MEVALRDSVYLSFVNERRVGGFRFLRAILVQRFQRSKDLVFIGKYDCMVGVSVLRHAFHVF